jgi:hypothetical protein
VTDILRGGVGEVVAAVTVTVAVAILAEVVTA